MTSDIMIQQNVVYKTEKGTPVTDSLKVAEVFGKQHKNIMQSIRNILGSAENSAHHGWFYESTYCDMQGKERPFFIACNGFDRGKGNAIQGWIH